VSMAGHSGEGGEVQCVLLTVPGIPSSSENWLFPASFQSLGGHWVWNKT
jgi:hypothetical protein